MKSPLATFKKMQDLRSRFSDDEKARFRSIEIRSPYEFLQDGSQLAGKRYTGFQLNYVFIRGDKLAIVEFVSLCYRCGLNMRLLTRRRERPGAYSDIVACTMSNADIVNFLKFCEDYMLFFNDSYIPFVDLADKPCMTGDVVQINSGFYKGQKGRMASDQPEPFSPMVNVTITWFGCVGLPVEVPRQDITIVRQAKHNNNKYRVFDEFYDYLLEEETMERLRNRAFTNTDLAKAFRMRKMAEKMLSTKADRDTSDSTRLRLIKTAALLMAYYILSEHTLQKQTKEQWDKFFQRVSSPKSYAPQLAALSIAYPDL